MTFRNAIVFTLISATFTACGSPGAAGLPGAVQQARAQQTAVQRGASGKTGTLGPIVQPKVRGEILGFDIDQHGNDGLLADYRDLKNGQTELSVETFDQRTGKITKIAKKQRSRSTSYAIEGILAHDIGLINAYPGYVLMNPVTGGKITGPWTPPVSFIISEVAKNQSTSTSVMLGYDNEYSALPTALVVADVAKGTGKVLAIDQSVFSTGGVPTVAQDVKTNQALITGGNGAQLTHPTLGIVDLKTGKIKEFQGLGYGSINGSGIDSTTDTACTTTNLDEGVEFYNLKTRNGFEVFVPNQGSQLQSGSTLAVDEVHHLCIVSQPVSIGQGTQQSAIWVFDEKGNQLEGISGFNFWFGAGMAINPSKRRGYVLNPRPGYRTLTGFTY